MGCKIEQFRVTQKNPLELSHDFLKDENKYVDVEEEKRSPKTLENDKIQKLTCENCMVKENLPTETS